MKARSKRNPARPANDIFLGFTSSVSFDSRLWRFDIAGSIAHAHALADAGVLNQSELRSITKGLKSLAKDVAAGQVRFDPKLEDVHMNVEKLLTDRIGPSGAKLHTGRSRNDQVALDLRLYTREALAEVASEALGLQATLVSKAHSAHAILPGLTHMQHAQPVLLSHHLMAHFWRLQRDLQRIFDCYRRTNVSPLGAGALAGTSFDLNRTIAESMLGMDGITENSMDAVSDRDFAAEAAFDLSLLQIHLSSLSEELVLWSSSEFGFVRLPKEMASGSSMMPQKLNPDLPELVRGKSGRALGDLVAILTLLKSLPLAYNRDLQEDKESLFDAFDTVRESLRALKTFLAEVEFDEVRMRKSAGIGMMTATDLADLLASQGMPFRKAHGVVKGLAAEANGDEERFISIAQSALPKGKMRASQYLSAEEAIARRKIPGGTSRPGVEKQIAQARKAIAGSKKSLASIVKSTKTVDGLLT